MLWQRWVLQNRVELIGYNLQLQSKGQVERTVNLPGTYYMHFISKRREVTEEEKQRALILAMQYSTRVPSFTVVMKASHVYRAFAVRIPKKWVKSHNVGDVRTAMLKVSTGKKVWDVGIQSSKMGKSFARGWAKFVLDNNLEAHDACVFELTNQGKGKANGAIMVFNVVIY